jgi:hypothetical protein
MHICYDCVLIFRDAWSLGAIDPTSGTATLLEITRVLGEMYKNGSFSCFS